MRFRFSQSVLSWMLLFFLASLPCFGGEVAILKNGFSIKHERREIVGDLTRLYVNASGSSFIDVPTAEIEHFEPAPPEPVEDSAARTESPVVPLRTASNGRPSAFPQRPVTDLSQVVNDASGRYRLDPDLVNSVIKAESGFNAHAVSPKGAQGLMQLMPGTAAQLGVPNAFDPQANVDGGTRYLRELLERYNFDLVKALAAYNAGPQRVEQFGGVPPYYETRAYVAKIVKDFNKKKIAQGKAAPSKSSVAQTKRSTTSATGTKKDSKTAAGTTVASAQGK
ncbi:MAG TPA: lytic transglycosylase domain-containing protein [Candidatus Binatia bacterium]|nr:lytic transglycosylase domain-containing protein [Candidatus Binatia bacterium]